MTATKRALITGVTGQDGAYLSKLLLDKGYEVHGLLRRSASADVVDSRLKWIGVAGKIMLHDGNLTDLSGLIRVFNEVKPDEVYNLAAQSFVKSSWQQPLLTGTVTGLGAANMLEAVRLDCPEARFYQASSSEMYGLIQEPIQSETTPFYPRSPYAAAKLYAPLDDGQLSRELRPARLQRHPVQPRIAAARHRVRDPQGHRRRRPHQARPRRRSCALGNIDAKRDWGHARDYVKAMWLMLQQDKPDDYVVATGRTTSVRDFCRLAFRHVGLNMEDHVDIDPAFSRPAEVDVLLGESRQGEGEARLGRPRRAWRTWSPRWSRPISRA